MKFKLINENTRGLNARPSQDSINEKLLTENGIGGFTNLKWAFCYIVGLTPSSNINIHHIDGNPKNRSGDNITLICPHTCSYQKAHSRVHKMPLTTAGILSIPAGNDATIYFLSDYQVGHPTHYGPYSIKV